MTLSSSAENHVRYSSNSGNAIVLNGTEAEFFTVNYLTANLNPRKVGNYQILVNYTLPFHNAGGRGILEIDLVVITQFGVFAIEVKDWRGIIEAYDGYWMQNQKYKHNDVFAQIDQKAKVLYSKLFGKGSALQELSGVSVTPIIVLFRGKDNFRNHSRFDDSSVVGVDNDLILALSSKKLLFRGQNSTTLPDKGIKDISDILFKTGSRQKEEIIGHYQVLGELSAGDLFRAFEAVHVDIPTMRVRLKAYQLPNTPSQTDEKIMKQIKNGTIAVSKLGAHPNILQTRDFFEDPERPDMFYEVTDPIEGERLDEFMNKFEEQVPLIIQIECIKQLSEALDHAHNHGIFHRNLSPETAFIINGRFIKLADFDFAKIVGGETISRPGEVLVDNEFTAPELFFNPSSASAASDIYSLGVLWFHLASLPRRDLIFTQKHIDELEIPETARRIIRIMTDKAPDNRPKSMKKIMEHLKVLEQGI